MNKFNLKEIAEQLDFGFRAFIHIETKKAIFVPDEDKFPDMDLDTFIEELDELENNFSAYREIEKWDSRESFTIMSDFAEQILDETLQTKLHNALNKKHPFREFKFIIDNTIEERQEWFNFKNKWQENYVESQIRFLES